MARLSKRKVSTAISNQRGNLTKVAEACGVSRSYVYRYIKKNEMWHLVEESRETLIDDLEDKAFQVAMKGNPSMLQFLLRTQGKQRGYVERQEITGAGGSEIVLKISGVKADDV